MRQSIVKLGLPRLAALAADCTRIGTGTGSTASAAEQAIDATLPGA